MTLQATPSTWRLLLEAGWKPQPSFRMLCGGEAVPRDLADELLATDGDLWNMYGPTETTIWSAIFPVNEGPAPVRIGHLSDVDIFITDEINPAIADVCRACSVEVIEVGRAPESDE